MAFYATSSFRAVTAAVIAFLAIPDEAHPEGKAPTAPPPLAWLVGTWKQPPAGPRWLELTWTATPDGVRGVLERVQNDGARTTTAVYLVVLRGEGVRLTWERQPDEKGPRPPSSSPRKQVARREVFKGSFGEGQSLQVGIDPAASDPGKRSKDDPVMLQIRVIDGTLLLEEKRATHHIKAAWSEVELVRVPAAASRPDR